MVSLSCFVSVELNIIIKQRYDDIHIPENPISNDSSFSKLNFNEGEETIALLRGKKKSQRNE